MSQPGEKPKSSLVIAEHAFMLDAELKNGNHFALPYSCLTSVALDPSTALVAVFASHTITITGLNLLAIHDAIANRAARKLVEHGNRPGKVFDGVPVIHTITVTARKNS